MFEESNGEADVKKYYSFDIGVTNLEQRACKRAKRGEPKETWNPSDFPRKARIGALGRGIAGVLLVIFFASAGVTRVRKAYTFVGIWLCASIVTARSARIQRWLRLV